MALYNQYWELIDHILIELERRRLGVSPNPNGSMFGLCHVMYASDYIYIYDVHIYIWIYPNSNCENGRGYVHRVWLEFSLIYIT